MTAILELGGYVEETESTRFDELVEGVLKEGPVLVKIEELVERGDSEEVDDCDMAVLERPVEEESKFILLTLEAPVSVELIKLEEEELIAESVALVETPVSVELIKLEEEELIAESVALVETPVSVELIRSEEEGEIIAESVALVETSVGEIIVLDALSVLDEKLSTSEDVKETAEDRTVMDGVPLSTELKTVEDAEVKPKDELGSDG